MNENNHQMIQSLWENIDVSHLAYLQENLNPKKLEKRKILEAVIKSFLTVIPPQNKFIFPKTRQVLRDTFQRSQNFNCDNTVSALQGIAIHASNLLTQPWRKELLTIELYYGFYNETIERGLVGGEAIFELMGYRKTNEVLVFGEPIDSDKVAAVSKDALIASVECQIINSIFSEVIKTCKEITWMDVFRHREVNPGSEQAAVTALIHLQTTYYHNSAPFYQPSMNSGNHPSPYVTNHQVVPLVPAQPPYQALGYYYPQQCSDFYSTTVQHPAAHLVTCSPGQYVDHNTLVGSPNEPLVPNHYHPHLQSPFGCHSRSSLDPTVASGVGQMNFIHHERRPVYTNTTMNEYNHQEVKSLWENIDISQWAYLQESQNVMKLERKRSLEALIRTYLTVIPPQNKFIFPKTRQVLRDTVQRSQDFNCDNSVSALHGIATHAYNLLSQPWKQEFQTIELCNEFYKDIIERGLIGGYLMFELMGYRKANEVLVFGEPINSDKVTAVSKDALIASVECQIIHSIYSEVIKTCKEITWIDVFRHREANPGSEQEAVAALIHLQTSYYHNSAPFYQPTMHSGNHRSTYVPTHQVVPLVPVQPTYQALGYYYPQQCSDFYSTTVQHPAAHLVTRPSGQYVEYNTLVGSPNEPLVPNHYHPHLHSQQPLGDHSRSSFDPVVRTGEQVNCGHHEWRPIFASTSQSENETGMDVEVYPRENEEIVIETEEQTNSSDNPNQGCYNENVEAEASTKRDSNSESKSNVQNPEVDSSDFNLDTLEYSLNELWKDEDEIEDLSMKNDSVRKKKKSTSVINTPIVESFQSKNVWGTDLEVCPGSNQGIIVGSEAQTYCTARNNQGLFIEEETCENREQVHNPEVFIMSGKSNTKEDTMPMTGGKHELPVCTLINKQGATTSDVGETSVKHSPSIQFENSSSRDTKGYSRNKQRIKTGSEKQTRYNMRRNRRSYDQDVGTEACINSEKVHNSEVVQPGKRQCRTSSFPS